MNNLGWLVLAILIAYGSAGVAPLLRFGIRGKVGTALGWGLVPILLACPLLIPSANLGLRALSAFLSGDLFFKMVDFFRQWDTLDRGSILREYYRFLIPFPIFAVVYPDHKRRILRPESPWPQVLRVVGGSAVFTLALVAILNLPRFAPVRSSFALNHVLILPIFVLAIESLSRALCGLERLAGFDTTPIIRNAYLSRTVSEFWLRYNNRVHDWLYRNVFQPTGGRRRLVKSILLTFLVSGLFHEVMFDEAISQVNGYQLAFFTIQGPAALASGRLDRLARRGGIAGKIVAHGATILFLTITSVLFFHGVSKIFPFTYVSQSPLP